MNEDQADRIIALLSEINGQLVVLGDRVEAVENKLSDISQDLGVVINDFEAALATKLDGIGEDSGSKLERIADRLDQ